MGHGNGWPSPLPQHPLSADPERLRAQPQPPAATTTSTSTSARAAIGAQIQLAKNAVVLLNHLCYASGNTEPGLAEGTLDQARQRVDNFAAGFIQAGASAVLAEAYAQPELLPRLVLGSRAPSMRSGGDAPNANGNAFAFESVRSPGYVAQMDPERPTSGFTRSHRPARRPHPGGRPRRGARVRLRIGRPEHPGPSGPADRPVDAEPGR